jgi:hypothetical protein
MAAESDLGAGGHNVLLLASMRPRPNGRGKRGQCHEVQRYDKASMRPRPNGRGKHQQRSVWAAVRPWLQ